MAKRGEVVAITGASAGIGRAAVEQFARRGARIGLMARDQSRLQATKQEVERLGGEALALSVDVADADAVEEAASKIEGEFGPLDIWINGAMAMLASARHRDAAGGVQARHGGNVFRLCLWHDSGAQKDDSARPWHDCAGGLRAGFPVHSTASGVLRREARNYGLYGLAPV
jgi:NAD(P)-dependent dehydrogenase (short-subunit alcohol dehydrogenase family)